MANISTRQNSDELQLVTMVAGKGGEDESREMKPVPPPFGEGVFSRNFVRDLRSDHAGETGAVWIYLGALRATRHPSLTAFARAHLETERLHLAFFDAWLPRKHQSRLLLLWKISGYLLGFFSALFGERVFYLTISAVESFVVEHYQQQIDYLCRDGNGSERTLLDTLKGFKHDEGEHREQAQAHLLAGGFTARAWTQAVGTGSRWAVYVARMI